MPNCPKALPALLTISLLLSLPSGGAADTKTQARAKAANSAPEAGKKGKKGAVAAKPAPAKQAKAKEKNSDKKLTAALNQRLQLAAKNSGKAETKLAKPKGPARNKTVNARTKANDNQLVSRLTGAKLVPASFVLNERRGKFGKATTTATRDNEAATTTNPPRNNTTQARRQPAPEASRAADRDDELLNNGDDSPQSRRPREVNTDNDHDTPAYNIAKPDKIEVIESGTSSPALAKLLALPDARPLTPFGAVVTKGNGPGKRNDLTIPPQRVLEIQYELAKRGFYTAEPNGMYDETTIQAMWEFQKNYGLPATGYPTAHSLKRLGLTSW